MKLIQITDLHLVEPGSTLFDCDPSERLRLCLEDIARHHQDADLVVITGDLAHNGEPSAYQALRSALERFPLPVRLLIGNHDIRSNFRACLPDAEVDADGFVQGAIDTERGRVLFLDTNQPGTHAGYLCDKRQHWLARQCLESDGGIYIFMHHPAGKIGYRPMDDLGLVNAEAFAGTIRGYDVRHIFAGHVHRPISGTWSGVPFSTLRGLNHQVWLDFSVADGIPCSLEPPAYAVILIESDSTIVHLHDFLDPSPKYLYRPDLHESEQVRWL
jgi:3',5'-cyclic-AMP phosphodiesterase